MWHTAAFWQPDVFVMSEDEALDVPELARYIEDWGRDGDLALIAEIDGARAGATWYRRFTSTEPGYGFVDEQTPELGIGVERVHRGRGVGTAMLDALIRHAAEAGLDRLSLAVNTNNPARRLYQRMGFVDDRADGDDGFVMVRSLRDEPAT